MAAHQRRERAEKNVAGQKHLDACDGEATHRAIRLGVVDSGIEADHPVEFATANTVNGNVSRWGQFILSTPVVLWAGWPFFTRAWDSLVNRSPLTRSRRAYTATTLSAVTSICACV